jgi:hypothetical protein
VEEDFWDETFNILSPKHPSRAEIWANCSKTPNADFTKSRDSSKKTINTEKFFSKSKYQFRFPDPLAFKYL